VTSGPLRRLVGTAGLVALAPTALLFASGAITPVEAGVRALVTLAVTVVVGRIAALWLDHLASAFERDEAHEPPPGEPAPKPDPARRRRGEADQGAQPR